MFARRETLRQAVMTVMAANRLDAILYPHQKRLVVPIGEDQADRNGVLSNSTGFPALTFPGGFSPPTADRADRRAGRARAARTRVERARCCSSWRSPSSRPRRFASRREHAAAEEVTK